MFDLIYVLFPDEALHLIDEILVLCKLKVFALGTVDVLQISAVLLELDGGVREVFLVRVQGVISNLRQFPHHLVEINFVKLDFIIHVVLQFGL